MCLSRKMNAFTIVELLVIIGIISILMAIILPAIMRVREAANKLACQSNMRQIALALHAFHTDYHRLPPLPAKGGRDENIVLGWMALIMPYIEENTSYYEAVLACRLEPDPTRSPPHRALSKVIKPYFCNTDGRLSTPLLHPSGVIASYTSYIGIGGVLPSGARRGYFGLLGDTPGCNFAAATDGLTNTLMFGERPPPDTLEAGWWYPGIWISKKRRIGPNNTLLLGAMTEYASADGCSKISIFALGNLNDPCSRFQIWSLHPGGANFAYGDASVRFLSYSYESVLIALGSRHGGEQINDP